MANALTFKIGADTAAFSSSIKKAAAAIVGIGAAFMAVKKIATDFQAAIDMGGRLNDLASRTGETAGNLMLLERAFQNAGAGADKVGPALNKMQRFMVEAEQRGGEQAETMRRLGLSFESLREKTPTEQLQAFAKAVAETDDPALRTTASMQVLGRSGGELIPLFRAMGVELETAKNQLGSAPRIIDATNQALDTIGDNMGAVREKSKEFALGLMSQLLPGLVSISDKLATIDAAGIGEAFSNYAKRALEWADSIFKVGEALTQIQQGLNAIVSGDIGGGLNLIWLTMRDAALNAINQISAAGIAALQAVGGLLNSLFAEDSALVKTAGHAFSLMGKMLSQAISQAVVDSLPHIKIFESAINKAKNNIAASGYEILSLQHSMASSAKNILTELGEDVAAIPAEFSKNYEANIGKPLIEMTDKMAETAAAAKEIEDNLANAADNMEKTAESAEKAASAMPDGYTPSGRATGEQHGPTAPPVTANAGGGGGRSPTPGTGIDSRRFDRNNQRLNDRINQFEGQGRFGAADNARAQLERRREREIDRQAEREVTKGRDAAAIIRDKAFADKKSGQSIQEAREKAEKDLQDKIKQARDKITGEVDEAMDKSEQASNATSAGSGGGGGETIDQIVKAIRDFVDSIDKKLPQHALA